MTSPLDLAPGGPSPLGATLRDEGVAFSVFSKHAERVDLLLFDEVDEAEPARVITLDPQLHRTHHYWHVHVRGLVAGQLYAYRVHGPWAPDEGHRFDPDKVLLDPYGRAVATPKHYDRLAARKPGRNDAVALKSMVTDVSQYDWEGDTPLHTPFSQTVIYEAHVRGFTRDPSSGVEPELAGTYAGFIEKIPYLVDLGVTAVELLPVFAFDPEDAPEGRLNYWGYAPVSFFAPHPGYATDPSGHAPLDELRDLIKALHRAGLEVILDVVYNHTAEGDEVGSTQSLKGFGNRTYYLLGPDGSYKNYSGTGNALNANRSVVRRMILDSLRYWVEEFHVDGFRFDLASILSRDENGHPLPTPPVLWDIDTDPVLSGTKLIAEAWDAAGLYQVGSFVGDFWKEWNGQFRDDVRRFVRGEPNVVPKLANRLLGSPDLYGHEPREPERSINFVTAHDGFTLNDLVSYDHKHNEANGEHNRDGERLNHSWNHGEEGPTADPEVEALRNRQVKNLLAITLLSLGAPMLSMGDEVRRTQRGNNNAYCQDNEISWFDWTKLTEHADVHRFVRALIGVRRMQDRVGHRRESLRPGLTLTEVRESAQVQLHGIHLGQPDFAPHSRSIAISAQNLSGSTRMYFALNAWWEPLWFELPHGASWRRVVDTSRVSPDDARPFEEAPVIESTHVEVGPRSVVALFARDSS
ncbi:MAG: glycogen debranching protein GlgX [Sandaracinaceae bacterium]